MSTLKNHRTIKSGKLWNAYFEQAKTGHLGFEVVEKKAPFGRRWHYEENYNTFRSNEKIYAVKGFDHFNGHFSNFTDESAIQAIHIAEVCF